MPSDISEIEALPRWKYRTCDCGTEIKTYCLKIYSVCLKCGDEQKQRAFGSIGTEIHDTIDAVLEWAGSGEDFNAFMDRYDEIQEHKGRLDK